MICWIAKIYLASYQSIKQQRKRVGYKDTLDVAKKAAEVAQKKEQQLVHGEFYPQWKWDNNLDVA